MDAITRVYPGGAVYGGEYVSDQRHGHGTCTFSDGTFYEGDWVDDKRHGRGKQTVPDGIVYEGGWRDGKKHGHGEFVKEGSVVAKGIFRDGCYKMLSKIERIPEILVPHKCTNVVVLTDRDPKTPLPETRRLPELLDHRRVELIDLTAATRSVEISEDTNLLVICLHGTRCRVAIGRAFYNPSIFEAALKKLSDRAIIVLFSCSTGAFASGEAAAGPCFAEDLMALCPPSKGIRVVAPTKSVNFLGIRIQDSTDGSIVQIALQNLIDTDITRIFGPVESLAPDGGDIAHL
jgi:hypothetical protein